jgi:predicted nucleic acid-binding Zn ribbon protein
MTDLEHRISCLEKEIKEGKRVVRILVVWIYVLALILLIVTLSSIGR